MNDALNIDARIFCLDILAGGRAWLAAVEGSQTYLRNYDLFLKRHPEGLAPYVGGAPVIG